MSEPQQPRYGIDPYLDWVRREGLPVTEDYGVDLFAVETADWPRYGAKGGAVHMKGRGDFASMFVLEIAPGKSTVPQRHLYEDVYYVLEGQGSTQLEFADGTVGIDHFPQHLDDAQPARLVERAHQQAGEMIEIDRLVVVLRRLGDQLVGRGGVEPVLRLEDGLQLATLGVGKLAVEGGDMHQQRRGGAAKIVLGELMLSFPSVDQLGEEFLELGKHRGP